MPDQEKNNSDLDKISAEIDQEIDTQQERLVEILGKGNLEQIKEEYKKIVEVLAKKLAVETKHLDEVAEKKVLSEQEKKTLLLEKDKLIKDYKETIITLACQIDELAGI